MKLINILNSSKIKYFDIKINQNIIKYKKKSFVRILGTHYYRNFKSLSKKNNFSNIDSLVISYTKSINNYDCLNCYDRYIRYSDLSLSLYQFLKELIYMPLFLIQYIKLVSDNKKQIFDAYLKSRLIIKNIEKNKISKVVFFGFDYDITFLFATLICNDKGVETIQYCNSGYLAEHNLIAANKIYCRTKIHKNYMLKRNNIFLSEKENINYFINPIKNKNIAKEKIAVYTSGYYARLNKEVHQKDFILDGINEEKRMINLIKEYAIKNKNIQITLFIHLHNNIENIYDAKEYYSDLLLLENVRLQRKDENSIENFQEYNLGICFRSEIFFDRYERGYKTVLFGKSIYFNDFINNSCLKNITIEEINFESINKINQYLNMDIEKYFFIMDN